MAINEGTADPEMPPESLAKSLQLSKPSLKNPLREKSSTKSDSDNTQTIPPPSPYSHYPPYSYPGYPPYFPPPPSHHQQALYLQFRVGKEPSRLAEPRRAGQDEPSRAKDFKLASRASERVGSLAGPKSHPASRGVRSLGSLVARSPGSPYSVTYISA